MFGRNKKRIEALEKQVEIFAKELDVMKLEVAALRRRVDSLVDEMVVAHMNEEEYLTLLQEKGDSEHAATILCIKDAYEKKLRRFIRNTTSKKRMVRKPVTDGKETPEAAE